MFYVNFLQVNIMNYSQIFTLYYQNLSAPFELATCCVKHCQWLSLWLQATYANPFSFIFYAFRDDFQSDIDFKMGLKEAKRESTANIMTEIHGWYICGHGWVQPNHAGYS